MQIPNKYTDEGNTKLARFLGVKVLEMNELIPKSIYDDVDKIPFLRFDKSFDWLFVVICYLEGLGYSVMIEDGACTIQEENGVEPIAWYNCQKDITPEELRLVVFNSCLEAIDNYYETTAEDAINKVLKNMNEWGIEFDSE